MLIYFQRRYLMTGVADTLYCCGYSNVLAKEVVQKNSQFFKKVPKFSYKLKREQQILVCTLVFLKHLHKTKGFQVTKSILATLTQAAQQKVISNNNWYEVGRCFSLLSFVIFEEKLLTDKDIYREFHPDNYDNYDNFKDVNYV